MTVKEWLIEKNEGIVGKLLEADQRKIVGDERTDRQLNAIFDELNTLAVNDELAGLHAAFRLGEANAIIDRVLQG